MPTWIDLPKVFFKSPKSYPSIKRWVEVLSLALISGLSAIVVLFFCASRLLPVYQASFAIVAPAALSLLLICIWAGWGRWGVILGYRHLIVYPPTWISAVLGYGLVSWAFSNLDGLTQPYVALRISKSTPILYFLFSHSPYWPIGIGLIIGIVPYIWFQVRRRSQKSLMDLPIGLTAVELDNWKLPNPPTWEAWGKWVGTDDSVIDPDSDIFRHEHIAQRIVRRLGGSDKPPAQAVIGELGSGKTSIGNLVKYELSKRQFFRRTLFIKVELWQYENAKAAVQGVVNELVTALQEEVMAFGLTELPAQYVEAMSAAGGGWSAFSKVLGWSSRPLDALKRLDEVACALNLHFVLWIEDLERYAGLAGKSIGPLTGEEFERVGPTRSLIHGLNSLKSVSIIIATTMHHSQMDLEKIAQYVEEIPSLRGDKVKRILASFRKAAFTKASGLVDPDAGEGRSDLDLLENDATYAFASQLWNGEFFYMAQALPLLCRTPRILKQSLRRCYEFWNENPGEIDFDVLLVANVLFYFDPIVFKYMRSHATAWYDQRSRHGRSGHEEDPSTAFLVGLGYEPIALLCY